MEIIRNIHAVIALIGVCCLLVGCPETSSVTDQSSGEADALMSDTADSESSWDDQKFQIFLDNNRSGGIPTIESGDTLTIKGTVTFPPQVNPSEIELRLVSDVQGVVSIIFPGEQGGFNYVWESPSAGIAAKEGGPAIQRMIVQGTDPDGSVATAVQYFYVNIPPSPPQFSVTPEVAVTNADLMVTGVVAEDVEGADLEFSFRWVKTGGSEAGAEEYEGNVLGAQRTTRGDVWTVYGKAFDGAHESEESSREFEIQNTPGKFEGCFIIATGPGIDAMYSCQGIQWSDDDGDPEQYHVGWFKHAGNDIQQLEVIEGVINLEDSKLSKKVRKDDRLFCVVTPFDGIDVGEPVTSPDVVVDNSVPSIEGVSISPSQPTVDSMVSCSYESVSDPDPEDEGALEVTVQWLVNGVIASEHLFADGVREHSRTPVQLDASRGDTISCQFLVRDTEGATGIDKTDTILVVNAPPVATGVTVVSSGGGPTEAGEFNCQFEGTSDPDLDVVSTIIFWEVNNHDVLDAGSKVTGNPLTPDFYDKGDVVRCALLLDDGSVFSEVVSENSLVVENSPPSLEGAAITPDDPNRNETVKCIPEGYADADQIDGLSKWDKADPDDTESPHYDVQWLADGTVVEGATTAVWIPFSQAPGTELQCRIRAFDGQAYSNEVFSNLATIVNEAPVLEAASLFPELVYVNSVFECVPGTSYDTDGDTVSLLFAWTLNGETVPGAISSTLDVELVVGDIVGCTIVPFDGYAFGAGMNSVKREVVNQQPSLVGVTIVEEMGDGGWEYVCDVEGILDADGTEDVTLSFTFEDDEGKILQAPSEDPSINAYAIEPGTQVSCTVTPFDGEGKGIALTSELVETSEWDPLILAVSLVPESPTRATGVECVVQLQPPNTGTEISFQWFQNGVQLPGQDQSIVPPGVLEKNKEVACVAALAADGIGAKTAVGTVLNTQPTNPVVTINPGAAGPNVALTCELEELPQDIDGDALSTIFVWSLDGSVIGGQSVLEAGGQGCQTLSCTASAFDGEATSNPSNEASLVVGEDTVLQLEGSGFGSLSPSESPIAVGDPFTLELWLHLESVAETVLIERTESYAPGGDGFGLWVTPEGQPAFVTMSAVSGQTLTEGVGAPLTANEWIHLAVTYDGNTVRLWKDGELVGGATGVILDTVSSGPLPLLVGGSAITSASSFEGQLDDIRISSIDRYGTVSFIPPVEMSLDPDTWILLDFDGGSGQNWQSETGEDFTLSPKTGAIVPIPCSL